MEYLSYAAYLGYIVAAIVLIKTTLWLFGGTVVNVGGDEVALLERRWSGKPMAQGRVIALSDEIGVQARTLPPGLHFLLPFIYKVTKVEMTTVEPGEIALVEAIDGTPVPPGHIFATAPAEAAFFQNGEAFLTQGGQKGPQVQTIPPGKYRINPRLFKITKIGQIEIPAGVVGVVTAQDGVPLPSGQLLGASVMGHNNFQDATKFLAGEGEKGPQVDILTPGIYRINTNIFKISVGNATIVETGQIGVVTAQAGAMLPDNDYVAKSVVDHNNFQQGAKFLAGGGQRGPQLEVLRPGIYYINPLLFQVKNVLMTEVTRGQVAVIVSNVGDEPTDEVKAKLSLQVGPATTSGKETYVVPKGYRGIQEEVLGPGRYYLNRNAFIPYIVDTTNITIDWTDGDETTFNPLQVVSKDGFSISVSVKVIIRVRPDQAPYMVAKVGSIENLIAHVIHPMIDSSFRNQASSAAAMSFMQNRQDEQKKAEDLARNELEKYHVECVSVLICQIVLPQELMDTQTKAVIAQQEVEQYKQQELAAQGSILLENTKANALQQPAIVKATMAVKIAEQEKTEQITLASAKSESDKLIGLGQASKIAAVGNAQAEAYKNQVAALGQNGLVLMDVMKNIADGKVKITPDIVAGNGGDGINAMIMQMFAKQLQPTQPVTPQPIEPQA